MFSRDCINGMQCMYVCNLVVVNCVPPMMLWFSHHCFQQQLLNVNAEVKDLLVCVYMCVQACIHMCMCVQACIHMCMSVCVCVCVYVCVCVSTDAASTRPVCGQHSDTPEFASHVVIKAI